MTEHPSLKIEKKTIEKEAEAVAKEFVEPFKTIVESRRKLRETEEELRGLITSMITKLDSLGELRKETLQLEQNVLKKINAELDR